MYFAAQVSQRTLESPSKTDCAFAFLFMLVQGGVRPSLTKLFDWGPSRRMLALASTMDPLNMKTQ